MPQRQRRARSVPMRRGVIPVPFFSRHSFGDTDDQSRNDQNQQTRCGASPSRLVNLGSVSTALISLLSFSTISVGVRRDPEAIIEFNPIQASVFSSKKIFKFGVIEPLAVALRPGVTTSRQPAPCARFAATSACRRKAGKSLGQT